jgi:hypothetical protein
MIIHRFCLQMADPSGYGKKGGEHSGGGTGGVQE